MLLRRVERRIENALGEDHFGLKEEKEPGMQLRCQE
jgi:hypothetical protein